MSAAVIEMVTASSAKALAQCKELVSNSNATAEQRILAVLSAYELGVGEGRVAGMTEMADKMIASLKT